MVKAFTTGEDGAVIVRGDVLVKLTQVLSEVLEVDTDQVNLESKLWDDLGLASLQEVELAVALEDQFGIEIPDDKPFERDTVGSLYTEVVRIIDSMA